MENRNFSEVIGNADAPYVNGLAGRFGLANDYFGIAHPSLPNYLALIGGSTFGVTSDCTDCNVDAPSLVDQLESKAITWRAYMEGFPSECYTGAESDGYVKKHDPFIYFDGVVNDPDRCSNIVSYDQLSEDIAGGSLPDFIWISPDLCNDGHDCSTADADTFLSEAMPPLLDALGPGGVLFLTWDEADDDSEGCCGQDRGGGRVVTIVAGPGAARGQTSDVAYNHYSMLRTIQLLLGLPPLGESGSPEILPMTDLLQAGTLPGS